jgi:glycosyltransferase involved in cell wall biosynthesis
VHVVPGCVSDLGLSGEIRPDKQRLIDQCTWPRLVYIAHPAQHKNHVTLIRALPRILERYPDTKLLLTMEPHARNGMVDTGCVRRIQQLAEELGLGNHVVWLGVLSPQEVRYLLRQATVSVFPSLDESFGLPLAEIITEGCPLAASDRPFARDVAGKAAEYFDPLDPDSIARCVTALIGTPQRLEQLRREARERQVCFQPRKVAEQVARILEAAVDHQRDGHARVGTEVC